MTSPHTSPASPAGPTVEPRPPEPRPREPHPQSPPQPRLRGLLWLAWRQHRTARWTMLALFLLAVGALVWQRFALTGYIDAHPIGPCDAECAKLDEYGVSATHFAREARDPLAYVGYALLALPALIGAFLGAPLIAREWETGTHKLAWSQSVSRRRWLTAQLGLPAALTVALTGGIVLAYRWWWTAGVDWQNTLENYLASNTYPLAWYDAPYAQATGPLLVALALFALILGTAAGLLLRRTLPAMGLTLAVTVGLQLALSKSLSSLASWTSTERITSAPQKSPDLKPSELAQGKDYGITVRDSGGALVDVPVGDVPEYCGSFPDAPTADSCRAPNDIVQRWADVHPADSFWQLQAGTTALVLLLAAGLTVLCVRLLRRP